MPRDLSPVLRVSLGNSNSLSRCNLFPPSLLLRPVLLSVSSSCSFRDALFLQLSPFLLLNTPYSSHSPDPSTDLSPGISPFFPPSAGSLQRSAIVSFFSLALVSAVGFHPNPCPSGGKLAQSWVPQPKQPSPRSTKNNPCGDLCYQWQIKG